MAGQARGVALPASRQHAAFRGRDPGHLGGGETSTEAAVPGTADGHTVEEAPMQCPVCDVRLAVTDRQGVEIDHCPRCRGVWLDRGELDKLIERAGSRSWRDRHED